MIILAKIKNTPEVNKEDIDANSVDLNEDIAETEQEAGLNNESDSSETAKSKNKKDHPPVEYEKYLRLAAEYENFRIRSSKERDAIYSNARIDAISKILPVYDNLERALKMECSDESYRKGVEMIMTQFTETFNDLGVEEIPAVGQPFDPNRHNAVMSVENPEVGKNIIVDEFQKGFTLGDRVIRFSTVVVAN